MAPAGTRLMRAVDLMMIARDADPAGDWSFLERAVRALQQVRRPVDLSNVSSVGSAVSDTEALRTAFEKIYDENLWGNGSGPGSSPANTVEYRAFLARFLGSNAIRTVTDLGCGDWQFSKLLDWSAVNYTGIDVVEAVVELLAPRAKTDCSEFAAVRADAAAVANTDPQTLDASAG